eukprot:5905889-Amphidinium_carterae.1
MSGSQLFYICDWTQMGGRILTFLDGRGGCRTLFAGKHCDTRTVHSNIVALSKRTLAEATTRPSLVVTTNSTSPAGQLHVSGPASPGG